MDALARELAEVNSRPHGGKQKREALWPVHQINHQRSRYVYSMFYKHRKISKELYDYCLREKLADANLIAKWKKPGYERLCSTIVINPKNFPFGTTSICRVPRNSRVKKNIVEAHTGCRGCASGDGSSNIFGNKYGQDLAKIQIKREEKLESTLANNEGPWGVLSDDEDEDSDEGNSEAEDKNGDEIEANEDRESQVVGESQVRGESQVIGNGNSLTISSHGETEKSSAGNQSLLPGKLTLEARLAEHEEERNSAFIAATEFSGFKPGFYFGTGSRGLGYYIDNNINRWQATQLAIPGHPNKKKRKL